MQGDAGLARDIAVMLEAVKAITPAQREGIERILGSISAVAVGSLTHKQAEDALRWRAR